MAQRGRVFHPPHTHTLGLEGLLHRPAGVRVSLTASSLVAKPNIKAPIAGKYVDGKWRVCALEN